MAIPTFTEIPKWCKSNPESEMLMHMTQGPLKVPDLTQGPKDLSPKYKPLKMRTKLTEFRKKDREHKTFMGHGTKKLLKVKERSAWKKGPEKENH